MKGMRKISRGRGFRGALNYVFERDDEKKAHPGIMIGGNMSGSNPAELSKEFSLSRQLRPSVKKPVWHNSLRLPAGERISEERWRAIADDYMTAMGFSELHQRAVVMHDDPDGQHIHIVASRIDLAGGLWLGQNDNLLSTRVISRLEKKHKLTITKCVDFDLDGKIVMPAESCLKKGEIEKALITGERPAKLVLQELITNAAKRKPTATEFIRKLEAQGVTVVPNIASTGTMNGFSFEYGGVAFSGSALGNRYRWFSLQKVIDYDEARDSKEFTARRNASRNNLDAIKPGGLDVNDRDAHAAVPADGAAAGGADTTAGHAQRDARALESSDLQAPGEAAARSTEVDRSGADFDDSSYIDGEIDGIEIASDREGFAAALERGNSTSSVGKTARRSVGSGNRDSALENVVDEASSAGGWANSINNLESSNDGRANRSARRNRNPGKTLSQRDVERIRNDSPSETIHSVRSMHARSVDRDPRDAQMLLPRAVSTQLDERGIGGHNALRRAEHRGHGMRTTVAVAVPAGPLSAMFIDQVAARPATAAVDTVSPGDAKAQDSMRAMQRVIDDEAQRATFRDFLRGLAEDGNRHALEVLRSASAPALTFAKSRQDGFIGDDKAAIALKHELQHIVAKNGDVSYRFDGKEILRDLGTTVLVIDKSDAGMLLGLRLAQAKFGQAISMHGDADFIERNCFIAAKNGLDISFKDPAHQVMLDRQRESILRPAQAEGDRDRIHLTVACRWVQT